ncbi:fluoride efflux transporter CrcB [Marisediminicola senii]|uniref:fluoride efflux transporter CrcB n=1 Tax=Marisediminicola senii TaxID=2711233 RepID=UPI0013ED9E02|nr:fluoride efflux transporter CrcB [Marisediminicola senii]
MTPLLFLAVAAAGGLGAAMRFVIDSAVRAAMTREFPLGIMLINISGSLVLGTISGLAVTGGVSETWALVIGVGLLGGYTTFSTASLDTVRLAQQGRYVASLVNGFGMLVISVAAAIMGVIAGVALGG